jgi:hypothetical protein
LLPLLVPKSSLVDDLSPELELFVTTSFRGARFDADIVEAGGDETEVRMVPQTLGGGWNNWQLWFIIWGLSFVEALGNKVEKKLIVGCAKLVTSWGLEGFCDAQLERGIIFPIRKLTS